MWRTHFIENNEVKYLPKGWRIDHKMERNFGAHSKFGKKNDEEEKEEDAGGEEMEKEDITLREQARR